MLDEPRFAVSLVMFATNTVKGPEEGPYASALMNFARALADAGGTWFVELVTRWRGALHSGRLVDQAGQNWFRTIQAKTLLPHDPAAASARRAAWRDRQLAPLRFPDRAPRPAPDDPRHLPAHCRPPRRL